MDKIEIPKIVNSFQNVNPTAVHGMLVLNSAKMYGLIQIPGKLSLIPIDKFVVVGYPTKILKNLMNNIILNWEFQVLVIYLLPLLIYQLFLCLRFRRWTKKWRVLNTSL